MFNCSENRAALSAMLNHNRKVLRGLHVIAGYDFEKPFSVYKTNTLKRSRTKRRVKPLNLI